MTIYPIKDIPHLEQDQFYNALISGQLNSLDLPAREYFERQELIAEEVKKREILKEAEGSLGGYYYLHKKGKKGDEYDVPKAGIAFFVKEGSSPEIIFFPSEEERDRIVEYFIKTGKLRYYNPMMRGEVENEVYSVLPLSIDGIYILDEEMTLYYTP